MKHFITAFLLAFIALTAEAEQFRAFKKDNEGESIARYTTYYTVDDKTDGFKKIFKGCVAMSATDFIKREKLMFDKAIVGAYYCINDVYVIANDYKGYTKKKSK